MKGAWQTLVRASSGYLELEMFDDAAQVDMAATIASRLVKLEPKDAAWWIVFAYSTRCAQTIDISRLALDEEDLRPLWDWIGSSK